MTSVEKDFLTTFGPEPGNPDQSDHSIFPDRQFIKDELSTRHFRKKGVVAMANQAADRNASTFFVTLTD